MKLKVLTVSDNQEATIPLLNSLSKNNWDYHVIETPFRGFGTKLIETYYYLKDNQNITHFIFCDAFDVIALGGYDEFIKKLELFSDYKIICSSEKGCWPVEDYRKFYEPQYDHGFSFLNSGLYFAEVKAFFDLMDIRDVEYSADDQQFFTEAYLFDEDSGIILDTEQVLFNSHSFINDTEYGYENGRIQILGNEPIFIHKNGRTTDPKLDELI